MNRFRDTVNFCWLSLMLAFCSTAFGQSIRPQGSPRSTSQNSTRGLSTTRSTPKR